MNPNGTRQFFNQDDPSIFTPDIQVNLDDLMTSSASSPEQNIEHPSFEEQFAATQSVESRGGVICYVEVKPENLDPEELPIVLAGGWTEGPEAFKGTMEELYTRGRWVISVNHPTHGNTVEPKDGHPEVKLFKAANYEDVLEAKGIEKADVIAHSAGAGDAAVWALLSKRVRNMVLANPEGVIGEDSFPRLSGRFAPKLGRSLATAPINKAALRGVLHSSLGGRPHPAKLKRLWNEVMAISRADLKGSISTLRAKGHKIGVLQSNADPVFPAKRIAENMNLDDIDSYASNIKKHAGHDELSIQPERGAVAADQMLRSFEDTSHPSLLVEHQQRAKQSQKAAAWIQSRWQTSRMREALVTGEHVKRNRVIAAAIGVAAVAGGAYLGQKLGIDVGQPDIGNGGEGLDGIDTTTTTIDTTTTVPESPSPDALPQTPGPRGDISTELNLPDNYLAEVDGGYEVTAMPGHETDSVWKAAEHALTDRLGKPPSVTQIDALKDILGEHLLDVGDTVSVTNEQIDQVIS